MVYPTRVDYNPQCERMTREQAFEKAQSGIPLKTGPFLRIEFSDGSVCDTSDPEVMEKVLADLSAISPALKNLMK